MSSGSPAAEVAAMAIQSSFRGKQARDMRPKTHLLPHTPWTPPPGFEWHPGQLVADESWAVCDDPQTFGLNVTRVISLLRASEPMLEPDRYAPTRLLIHACWLAVYGQNSPVRLLMGPAGANGVRLKSFLDPKEKAAIFDDVYRKLTADPHSPRGALLKEAEVVEKRFNYADVTRAGAHVKGDRGALLVPFIVSKTLMEYVHEVPRFVKLPSTWAAPLARAQPPSTAAADEARRIASQPLGSYSAFTPRGGSGREGGRPSASFAGGVGARAGAGSVSGRNPYGVDIPQRERGAQGRRAASPRARMPNRAAADRAAAERAAASGPTGRSLMLASGVRGTFVGSGSGALRASGGEAPSYRRSPPREPGARVAPPPRPPPASASPEAVLDYFLQALYHLLWRDYARTSDVFRAWDEDEDGLLGVRELIDGARNVGVPLSAEHEAALGDALARRVGAPITYAQLHAALFKRSAETVDALRFGGSWEEWMSKYDGKYAWCAPHRAPSPPRRKPSPQRGAALRSPRGAPPPGFGGGGAPAEPRRLSFDEAEALANGPPPPLGAHRPPSLELMGAPYSPRAQPPPRGRSPTPPRRAPTPPPSAPPPRHGSPPPMPPPRFAPPSPRGPAPTRPPPPRRAPSLPGLLVLRARVESGQLTPRTYDELRAAGAAGARLTLRLPPVLGAVLDASLPPHVRASARGPAGLAAAAGLAVDLPLGLESADARAEAHVQLPADSAAAEELAYVLLGARAPTASADDRCIDVELSAVGGSLGGRPLARARVDLAELLEYGDLSGARLALAAGSGEAPRGYVRVSTALAAELGALEARARDVEAAEAGGAGGGGGVDEAGASLRARASQLAADAAAEADAAAAAELAAERAARGRERARADAAEWARGRGRERRAATPPPGARRRAPSPPPRRAAEPADTWHAAGAAGAYSLNYSERPLSARAAPRARSASPARRAPRAAPPPAPAWVAMATGGGAGGLDAGWGHADADPGWGASADALAGEVVAHVRRVRSAAPAPLPLATYVVVTAGGAARRALPAESGGARGGGSAPELSTVSIPVSAHTAARADLLLEAFGWEPHSGERRIGGAAVPVSTVREWGEITRTWPLVDELGVPAGEALVDLSWRAAGPPGSPGGALRATWAAGHAAEPYGGAPAPRAFTASAYTAGPLSRSPPPPPPPPARAVHHASAAHAAAEWSHGGYAYAAARGRTSPPAASAYPRRAPLLGRPRPAGWAGYSDARAVEADLDSLIAELRSGHELGSLDTHRAYGGGGLGGAATLADLSATTATILAAERVGRSLDKHRQPRGVFSAIGSTRGEVRTRALDAAAAGPSDERLCSLELHVVRARGLAKKNLLGGSDPYVLAFCLDGLDEGREQLVRTEVVKGTLEPSWAEGAATFELPASFGGLHLVMFDWAAAGRHALMGEVVLGAAETLELARSEQVAREGRWFQLQQPAGSSDGADGAVLLRLRAHDLAPGVTRSALLASPAAAAVELRPEVSAELEAHRAPPALLGGGSLQSKWQPAPAPAGEPPFARLRLRIVEARELRAADAQGSSDPYCRAWLGSSFWQTAVRRSTLAPRWDDEQVFDVSRSDALLHVVLWDWDQIGRHDYLGELLLPFAALRAAGPTDGWYALASHDPKLPAQGAVRLVTEALGADDARDVFAGAGGAGDVFARRDAQPTQHVAASLGLEPEYRGGADADDDAPLLSARALPPDAAEEARRHRRPFRSASAGLTTGTGLELERALHSLPPEQRRVRVHVRVVEARGLMVSDMSGSSDPYCVVYAGASHLRTPVRKRTLSPQWDADAVLDVPLDGYPLAALALHVVVFDWDLGSSDDFLGEALVPLERLEALAPGEPLDRWFRLTNADGGTDGVSGSVRLELRAVVDDSAAARERRSLRSSVASSPRGGGGGGGGSLDERLRGAYEPPSSSRLAPPSPSALGGRRRTAGEGDDEYGYGEVYDDNAY